MTNPFYLKSESNKQYDKRFSLASLSLGEFRPKVGVHRQER